MPDGLGLLMAIHKNYLWDRGFDPEEMERLWGVMGIALNSGKLSWRIWIPVRFNGQIVSWTTRAVSDKHPMRYLNAKPTEESMSLKSLLFGEDYCRHSIVVTEGPFDAMRIGPGATCTFGTSYTQAQLAKIAKYPVRVVAFDSEPEAQRRSRELCSALECFEGKTYRVELNASDPGSATEKEIRQLRKKFLD